MGPATDVRRLDAAIDQRDLGPPANAHGALYVAVFAQPRRVAAEAHEGLLGRTLGLRRSLRGLRRGDAGSAMLDCDASDGAARSQHEKCAHDSRKAGQAVTVRRGAAERAVGLATRPPITRREARATEERGARCAGAPVAARHKGVRARSMEAHDTIPLAACCVLLASARFIRHTEQIDGALQHQRPGQPFFVAPWHDEHCVAVLSRLEGRPHRGKVARAAASADHQRRRGCHATSLVTSLVRGRRGVGLHVVSADYSLRAATVGWRQ